MSSAVEIQASFDDVREFVTPIAYPLVVRDLFNHQVVARAIRVDGGGDIEVKTAAGESRTLTGLEDPFYMELKITEVINASAATKIRLYV